MPKPDYPIHGLVTDRSDNSIEFNGLLRNRGIFRVLNDVEHERIASECGLLAHQLYLKNMHYFGLSRISHLHEIPILRASLDYCRYHLASTVSDVNSVLTKLIRLYQIVIKHAEIGDSYETSTMTINLVVKGACRIFLKGNNGELVHLIVLDNIPYMSAVIQNNDTAALSMILGDYIPCLNGIQLYVVERSVDELYFHINEGLK